jgi:pimeloyl-ACP methyl ester carboxylesterase
MPDTSSSNPFAALAGRKSESYTAEDMTDDAVAVMDALGWERAHVFGHSMGGTLAQRIALRHPDRVLSIVSSAAVPSDASGISVFRYLRFGLLARLARAKFPEGREGDIEANLAVARGVASRTYPFDEDEAREWIERQVDTGPRDTKAQSRQIGAKWHGPKLRSMTAPATAMVPASPPVTWRSCWIRTPRARSGPCSRSCAAMRSSPLMSTGCVPSIAGSTPPSPASSRVTLRPRGCWRTS